MSPADGSNVGVGSGPGATETTEDSRRVLVTGAAGFIGSHLCERMLDEGWEVWGLDNLSAEYSLDQKRSNLQAALEQARMHFVEGDLRDPILLNGLLHDHPPHVVVHLAACHCNTPSGQDPQVCFDVNVIGTLKLLEAMAANHLRSLVLASNLPRQEAGDGIYRAAKRSAELLVQAYSETQSLSAHVIRLAPVYGPRERPDLPVHSMARLVSTENGTGGIDLSALSETWPQAPYLFVDDAVRQIAAKVDALDTARRDGATASCEVSSISGPRDVGAEEIVRGLRAVLGRAGSGEDSSRDDPGVEVPGEAEPGASTQDDGSNVAFGVGLSRFADWFEATTSEPATASLTSAGAS